MKEVSMAESGYSKRSLAEKLGLKPGQTVAIFNPPDSYFDEIEADGLPEGIIFAESLSQPIDFIHIFTAKKADLEHEFKALAEALTPAGALWVSWPKGTSGVPTDLNENIIREIGLVHSLVDVKVIAVDGIWSGLKFVYRLKDRPLK